MYRTLELQENYATANALLKVEMWRNAKIVLGIHGADFTNLVFARPDALVVEVMEKWDN